MATYTGPPSIDRDVAIAHLADTLRELLPVDLAFRAEGADDDHPSMDVRIRVRFDVDAWYFSTGSSDYEQDHRGCWGSSVLGHETTPEDCNDIAEAMWAEAEAQQEDQTS